MTLIRYFMDLVFVFGKHSIFYEDFFFHEVFIEISCAEALEINSNKPYISHV